MENPVTALSRRLVLGGILAMPFVTSTAEAATRVKAPGGTRALSMVHLHTDERITATYWRRGRYDRKAWREINHFLRDWRTGQVHAIDPRTLDIVHRIALHMGHRGPIEILSGYRSPRTNAMLRRASSGVAQNSYHLQGKALDFNLPGKSLRSIYKAAVALNAGGVGYYSGSGFVHIDTGPVRTWGA
jgi:uncharacterized protein YcbK (DUF882 family)